jgi:hypothetical protein
VSTDDSLNDALDRDTASIRAAVEEAMTKRAIKVGPNQWYRPTPPRQSDIDYMIEQNGG